MSKDKNITLSICGNADSNSGYQQLVAIEPAFYPEDKPYSAVMSNESYYTLQIRTDVTILIKTINNVCSYGQTRDGRLRLGISIPAGLCVSNPKMLIDEIEAAFKNNYMTLGQKWQFKRAEYDANIFSRIIQKYPLLPSPSAHRVMSSSGNVGYVFTPRIMELLKDYQYKEFQPYGEIVIAETGNATSGEIHSLSIPRHSIYDVFVMQNGRIIQTLDPITDTRRTWSFNVYPENQTIYGPALVEFSIDELKGLLSGDKDFTWGQVSLDEKQETVSIKVLSFPENLFIGKLTVTGEKIDLSKLKLNNGQSIKNVSATGSFQLAGREIYEMWSVSYPSDRTLTFSPPELNFQMQLSQTISVTKPKPFIPKPVEPLLPVNKDSKPVDDNYIVFPVEAKIVNPQGVEKDFFVNIFMTQSDGGWEYARKITLSKVKEGQNEKNTFWDFKGEVPVPKDMVGKGTSSFSVRATAPALNIHFLNDDVQLKKNSTIKLGDDKPGKGLKKSMPLLYALLLALGMLLIGGAAGWGITKWLIGTPKQTSSNPAPSDSDTGLSTPSQPTPGLPATGQTTTPSDSTNLSNGSPQIDVSTANNQTNIEHEYNKKLASIKKLDFEFDWISDYKQFLSGPEATKIDEKRRKDTDKLSYHVKVAEDVYNAISSEYSTDATIKNAVGKYADRRNTNLDQKIRAAICASYLGDFRYQKNTKVYSRAEKDIAVDLARTCNSYEDLYYLPDTVFNEE